MRNELHPAPSVKHDEVVAPSLTPERWARIKRVFSDALEREPSERTAFIAAACSDDMALRQEVASLLAAAESAARPTGVFMGSPKIAPTISPGTKLGQYEVVAVLGKGGMSEVYRARDLRLGRDVAVKVLPTFLSSNANRLRRFKQEAHAAASLNHPNIVTIHAIEEVDGVHLIVMELIEGASLSGLIPEGGLPLEKFFEIAIALGKAVSAAHENGVIHRDLKPSNVMVDRRGCVKVLDFGLAIMPEHAGTDSIAGEHQRLTEPGMVMGTAPYMSPEQVQAKKIDERSDIFSLGAILYQMATGRAPFIADSPAEVMSCILRDSPPQITELRADAPTFLKRIVDRCLAKEVNERYVSSKELLKAITDAQQQFMFGLHANTVATSTDASVAVLPFLNLRAHPENDSFADGMTEEIINALTHIKNLHVAARTSSFSFKGKNVDLRVVGERLNVRTVLEGSVRRAGDRLRITSQLVSVADGYHLWSERYDRQINDIFEVQEDIARSIAEKLRVTFEATQPLVKAGTDSIEAYQLYTEGRTLFFQRGPQLVRSLDCFSRAVQVDSDYAAAWAGFSTASYMVGFYGLNKPEACLPQAKTAAERAVSLDPSLSDAHSAVAMVHLAYRQYSNAELEFLRALELNPRAAEARIWYGLYYLIWGAGRINEGIAQIKQAIDHDPLSSYARAMLSAAYAVARNPDAGLDAANAAVELDPSSFVARFMMSVHLWLKGLYEKAAMVGQSCLAPSGRHVWIVTTLAMIHADWGRMADAEALYMELYWRAKREYVQLAMLAFTASTIDTDAAICYLREGLERHDPVMIAVRGMPFSDRVRKDQRFCEITDALAVK